MEKEKLQIKDIAGIFHVSEATVRRWVDRGWLNPIEKNPFLKRPRLEFDATEVERFKDALPNFLKAA